MQVSNRESTTQMSSCKGNPTPLSAPILCQVRTGVATGSQLVGTVLVSLDKTLHDVRTLLCALAAGERTERQENENPEDKNEVNKVTKDEAELPVNVTPEELGRLRQFPLHPFDYKAPFTFVRGGSARFISRQREKSVRLIDVMPRVPLVFRGKCAWSLEPPPPIVQVREGGNGDSDGDRVSIRKALAVVFVAHGSPGALLPEPVLVERHMMQQAVYGRPYKLNDLTTLVNQWNVNVKDCFGRTVLHECVYLGAMEAVAYLLKLPFVRVNEQDWQGKTPLHLAVRGENKTIVSYLLDAGADILIADNAGNTVLHVALCRRNDDIVELLCRRLRTKGVAVDKLNLCKNNLGLSPIDIFQLYSPTFHQLCREGDIGSIKFLCKHYLFQRDLIFQCDELVQQSALHVSAAVGDVAILKLLLDDMELKKKGNSVMINSRWQTPLHIAAEKGNLEAVKFLLERYPKWLSMRDITGATPLVAALTRKPHLHVVDYLLSSSPRGTLAPNICNNSGMGALHLLCEYGMTGAANSLIVNHGADVALSQSSYQTTPKYLTITREVPRLSKLKEKILSRKEKVLTQQDVTPLLCAIRARVSRVDTIEMLLSCGAGGTEYEVIELLFFLLTKEHYKLAEQVVWAGLANSIHHNELINRFCRMKHDVGIRWCTEQGCCNLNSPEGGGYPLSVSAAVGDVRAVNYLLTHGADPNAPTEESPPLLLAINAGHEAVVEQLVKAGAKLTSSDASWSALSAAAERGAVSVVRAILGLQLLPSNEVFTALLRAMKKNVKERNRVVREQICVHLAQYFDPNVSGNIHSTELLHLAASRSFFEVVWVLAKRFLTLPTSTLQMVLNDAPPPPKRKYIIVEPTTTQSKKSSKFRVKNVWQRLYVVPKPFRRIQLQKLDKDMLYHRLYMRDVFSYCAAAKQYALLEYLLFDLGMKPWSGPDYRGWNAADYAVTVQQYEVVRMFLVIGLTPLRRHNIRSSTRLSTLLFAMTDVNIDVSETNLLSSVLCKLAAAKEVTLMRQILLDVCRQYGLTDLNAAGEWLDELILSSVNSGYVDLLRLMTEEFHITLSQHLRGSTQPLLIAVARRDISMVLYLIQNGIPTQLTGPIPEKLLPSTMRALKSQEREFSPLWLAARLGDTAMVELLLSTGSLILETCTDTTVRYRDALKAVIDGLPYRLSPHHDSLVAQTVTLLARAGHVYSSPTILREVARKGMTQAVKTIIDCYGPRVIVEDIVSNEICSLHYLIGNEALCPVLKSLIVKEIMMESAETGGEERRDIITAILRTDFKVNPVDYALTHNSVKGSVLLLALGLCGSGEEKRSCNQKFSRAIRLCITRRNTQMRNYSVLHAVVELQYYDILEMILNEGISLQYLEKYEEKTKDKTPSISSLSAFYCDRIHHRLVVSSEVSKAITFSLFDVLYCIFARCNCDGEQRNFLQYSNSNGDLEKAVDFQYTELPREFILNLVSDNHKSFFFENKTFCIAALTPMGCAVAAGNLSWVQWLTFSGVSLVNCNIVVAKRKPMKMTELECKRDHCHRHEKIFHYGFLFTDERYQISPLLLCMAIIIESARSRDAQLLLRQSEILRFLLSREKCLRREEVNPLAIAAAGLMLWDLLEAIIEAAERLENDPTEGRFFFTIREEEIPPIIGKAVGVARHVMHKAARCAPKEILVNITKHSQRTDIETSSDAKGNTTLYHALFHSSRYALEFFLGLRIPTNTPCNKNTGRTPLMIACLRGQLPLVKSLVEKGVLNATDHHGNTALLLAACAGHLNVVEHLLKKGADLSVRNNQGMTAVMAAAFAGHDDVAVALADNSSNMNDFFSPQTTLLHCSAVGGCWHMTTMLLNTMENVELLAKDSDGFSSVYLSYAMGNHRVLRTLLTAAMCKGIEPSPSLDMERRIFDCSAALHHYGWLKRVLQMDLALLEESRHRSSGQFRVRPGEMTYSCATTNLREFSGSLLLWCVKNNNVVGVRVLADMNIRDDCNALHKAAKYGLLGVVKLLVSLEMSDPNKTDKNGRLAFEIAAMHGHFSCVSYLLLHTKLNIEQLKTPSKVSAQNTFHCIASCGGAETLLALIEILEQKESGANWPLIASELLDALNTPDSNGMTAFESAVAMGNPAGVLRVAQTLKRLVTISKRDNALSISKAVLKSFSVISPAVRVILYDLFKVTEVATTVGFGRNQMKRLTFADVRLIGVNVLKRDTFCASETSGLFTLHHEIAVQSSLLRGLPFKISYEPGTLEKKSMREQVQLLQWLTSSLVLSNYENWSGDTTPEIVELKLVSHRSAEFADLSSRYLHHSVYVDSRRLLIPDLNYTLNYTKKKEIMQLRTEAEEMCLLLTQRLQGLSYPALKKGRVTVDWSGGGMTTKSITRLIYNGLAKVADFIEEKLRDCLYGVQEADMASVTSLQEDTVVGIRITFHYTHETIQERNLSLGSGCIILFSDDKIQDVNHILYLTVYNKILADVNLLRISFIRDDFVMKLMKLFVMRKETERFKFKLEVDKGVLHEFPLHLLCTLMEETVKAVKSLIIEPTTDMNKFHSSQIVSDFLTRNFRSVIIIFSPQHLPLVEFSDGTLILRLNTQLAPTRCDIYDCLRHSAVVSEIEWLKGNLPLLTSTVATHLNEYLPTCTLVIDTASFFEGQDEEFVLSALSLLCHDNSVHVLDPLIKGVLRGCARPLGDIVGRHVRQITLTLQAYGDATCVLYDSGNFLYSCSLYCVERGVYGTSSWNLLSTEQIYSLLMIQLASLEPLVAELIDTSKAFACWTHVHGPCDLRLRPGSKNKSLRIRRRNVLNLPLGSGIKETVEFKGDWCFVKLNKATGKVCFTAPKRLGCYYQHILMDGHPLYNSPIYFEVLTEENTKQKEKSASN
ncbi:ankyrin repeat protein [Trypanosoma theileri]|uniref:Ankyrin repeat protein n=1 Tax=Trypanosoma theileri TaxID=67003 RepID=A0A1X0P5X2_9TRYP|nr:ankyrin repeat protein [Trypanosoma theileri]ORC92337.1 ankyrin repeat protein [Trypanosoma theileri]